MATRRGVRRRLAPVPVLVLVLVLGVLSALALGALALRWASWVRWPR